MSVRGATQRMHDAHIPPSGSVSASTVAEIGPNSVLQTMEALREFAGAGGPPLLATRAAIPTEFPEGMIPEAWFVRVARELRLLLDGPDAEAVLRRSGTLTGEYVTRNRVPAPIRLLLRVLPPRLALPVLIQAFRQHAWTFAGSGDFRTEGPYPGVLVLEDAPTCRDGSGPSQSCGYYEAAFESLLQLAAPGIRVTETECRAGGAPFCRFRLDLPIRT